MECPHDCPSGLYSVMTRCWRWDAAARPDFARLHAEIDEIYTDLDVFGSSSSRAHSRQVSLDSQRPSAQQRPVESSRRRSSQPDIAEQQQQVKEASKNETRLRTRRNSAPSRKSLASSRCQASDEIESLNSKVVTSSSSNSLNNNEEWRRQRREGPPPPPPKRRWDFVLLVKS